MRSASGILLAMLLAFSVPQGADGRSIADNRAAEREKIERLVDAYHRNFDFSGVVMLSRDGQVVFENAYGLADRSFAVTNRIDTRFRIASSTKPFTALAVLKLAESGRLDLDTPLTGLFPALDPRITPRQLLTHRSGLGRDPTDLSDKGIESRFSTRELVDIAASAPLGFDPGDQFSYSNLGYSLLAIIIERITGKPYADSLQELVLEPLGLHNTFNEPHSQIIARQANGYFLLPDGVVDAAYEDKSHVLGAGSLTSTAGDLIDLLDSIESSDALKPETRQQFLRETEKNRSLGMVTWQYKVAPDSRQQPATGRVVMHSGSCPGFESAFGRFLDHRVSIAILSNQSPFPVGRLFNDLGNLMLDFDVAAPENTDSRFFREAIARGADAQFGHVKQSEAQAMAPSAGAMNRMGYNLLSAGRINDAITLFRINTLLYPDSANGFDSLCEAYAANGNTKQAMESCSAAIKLAPGNPGTIRLIRRLRLGGDPANSAAATRDQNTRMYQHQ